MNPQNYSADEIEKFAALAHDWWNPHGTMKALHDINPLRLAWMNEQCPFNHKKILDLGCGGGILTESMAMAGAQVTGIDMTAPLIETAKTHAQENQLNIHYECISSKDFAENNASEFDVVTCMELLEHVPDPVAIIQDCAHLVKPGGTVFFSTLNRNLKSYLLAILGAEYLLKLVPKGTHDYQQFIRPSELESWARNAGLKCVALKGIKASLRGLSKSVRYELTDDIQVNYMGRFIKSLSNS
jgi:2-polyprenyl-6-hydroxyphenyl methylase/3-demethylubiquinone-9 3-methyltransferase